MNSQVKIIFIPGNGGASVKRGWFPYVKNHLQQLGCIVIDQDFPDPIDAKARFWLPFIKSLSADESTVLIGHSSGAEAAMRFAENHQVLGTILVSPCYTDLGMESEKVSGYYNHPWNWENIKKNQQWIIQFSSTDDPYIPIEEGRHVQQMLDTEYYEFSDQGHFGGNWDKTEFPELINVVKNKLS